MAEEVSLTEDEDEDGVDDIEPKTSANNILSSNTITKFYSHFKEAIGNMQWLFGSLAWQNNFLSSNPYG